MNTWLAWIHDYEVHRRENDGGRNYWDVYLEEIADRLGAQAQRLEATQVTAADLRAYQAVLLGSLGDNCLSDTLLNALRAWVCRGGRLLAFGTRGLDEWLGLQASGTLYQTDDYSARANLHWSDDSRLAGDLRAPGFSQALLPCHAPVRRVQASRGVVHAWLSPVHTAGYPDMREGTQEDALAAQGQDSGVEPPAGLPGFVEVPIREGSVMYCTFDLPKAVWVLHQGRPVVTQPAHDGFYRGDTLSVYRAEQTVPAADELVLFLRNYLADVGQPFVSPLPPVDEEPADLLCYWGGDDEAIAGTHLPAAEFMHSQGLPYHSNILYRKDGTFAINRAEAEELERLGTEVSLHYNFREFGQHPRHFTRAEVHKQAVAFRETFGHAPGCTVNHWSLWTGWHHPAVWMAEAGGRGDNSFLPLKGDRPCFRFGTSFPYRFYADHTGENARLPFLAQPATCYEPLYGTPNNSGEGEDPRDRQGQSALLRRSIDVTAHYSGAINFFLHTYRLADWPASRGAVEFALGYLRERGLTAAHLGNDALCDWWEARSLTRATLSSVAPGEKRLEVSALSPHGVTVLLPLDRRAAVQLPGSRVAWRVREAFSRQWLEVAVPQGEHEIRVVGMS